MIESVVMQVNINLGGNEMNLTSSLDIFFFSSRRAFRYEYREFGKRDHDGN